MEETVVNKFISVYTLPGGSLTRIAPLTCRAETDWFE